MNKLKWIATALLLLLGIMPDVAVYAYQIDNLNHTITVSPATTPTATTQDLQKALTYLTNRPDTTTLWTLKLNPQRYFLTQQISSAGLKNVVITSSDLANPAQLIKNPGWDSAKSAEYLLYLRMCDHVQIIGLEFYGQTDFAKSAAPFWPDQGVYVGSCNVVLLDSNKFYNFGNAALRVVTDAHDPVLGVHSFKTHVTRNTFNNIYQTATTATDTLHGGTAQSTWDHNTFVNLRGSIKFASRTPGASQIEFFNNTVNGSDHLGLEVNNYSDFAIKGNTFKNIKEVAIDVYTGISNDIKKGFAWGDNFTIDSNTIQQCGRGIRYSHEAFPDGFNNTPQNLVIKNNLFDALLTPNTPAIFIGNGQIDKVQLNNNKLTSIKNTSAVQLGNDVHLIEAQQNTVDQAILQFAIPAKSK
jgi:hypothetical protein